MTKTPFTPEEEDKILKDLASKLTDADWAAIDVAAQTICDMSLSIPYPKRTELISLWETYIDDERTRALNNAALIPRDENVGNPDTKQELSHIALEAYVQMRVWQQAIEGYKQRQILVIRP